MEFLDEETIIYKDQIIEEILQEKKPKERAYLITTLLGIYCKDTNIVINGLDDTILKTLANNIKNVEIETNEFYCNLKLKKKNEIYNIYVSCDNEIYCLNDTNEVIDKDNKVNIFERNGDIRINHYCRNMDLIKAIIM